MELMAAKILLKNLLHRVETREDGSKQLTGKLTDEELAALQTAFGILDSSTTAAIPVSPGLSPPAPQMQPILRTSESNSESQTHADEPSQPKELKPNRRTKLNIGVLSYDKPPKNIRFCLDFGTAMSKATVIEDDDDAESEEIHVLPLGIPGDQEEISEVMLISSVYIDNEGKLWFGKAAINRSMIEGRNGLRGRLDNIKRRLSEEGWDEQVGVRFNPTGVPVTHGDMVIAYLMFMTWTVNCCLEELSYPRNLSRRFAMPCLSGEKGRETVHRLRTLVGEAQVLADTFCMTLNDGIPLCDFLRALRELRRESREYPYVLSDVTEPLGVAGSIVSWTNPVDTLMLVIDVGAGTSDLSLYRLRIDPTEGQTIAIEVEGSSGSLTEAGNHLDRLLIEQIVKESGITSEDEMWVNVRSALELEIREFKETLFNDGFVLVPLMNRTEVNIELNQFLELDAVQQFEKNLRMKMVDILESIDESWVKWIKVNPNRRLVVALTGGGSELPMVKTLSNGSVRVNGLDVPLARALSFPKWLRALDENLESDYPRVAVSLGGARRRLIERGDAARITAGDVTEPPELGGYYQKGN